MKENDLFIVFNPDLYIDSDSINEFILKINKGDLDIATINLYRDFEYHKHDNSIRRYPNIITFFSSFLFGINKTIMDKDNIVKPTIIDWCAGSFICFKSKVFSDLSGFNEKYFMYCEDIDICYRAKLKGFDTIYIPDIKATHLASHGNRNIFSKHFYWHVKNVCRFLFFKYKHKI